jgi:hypothetical protein
MGLVVAAPSLTLVSFNAQDNLVVELLSNAKFGNLPLDRLADLICKQGSGLQNRVAGLRKELIEVYPRGCQAAAVRERELVANFRHAAGAIILKNRPGEFELVRQILGHRGARRFPPPWSVEELDACFVVRDHGGQALAYIYFKQEPGRRSRPGCSGAKTADADA